MNMHMKHTTKAVAAHLLSSAGGLLTKSAEQQQPMDILTKKFGDHVTEVLSKLGATNEQLAEMKARLSEVEQKAVRRTGGGGDARPDTWGETLTKSREQELQKLSEERGRTSIEIKATITSSTANAAGSAGSLVVPQRDQLLGMPKRRLMVRDLLSVVEVTSGSVEYVEQTERTNRAAPTAEATTKPQSDYRFELKPVPIRTIPHWVKASKQILEDVPQLRDIIDQELIYGLAIEEEAQLISGSGLGQNLNGMMPQATEYNDAFSVDFMNHIDAIGIAILQVTLTDLQPDGIILHPSDWWRMRLLKDANGKYIMGDPQAVVAPSLFGLPVVPTPSMEAGEFLVGAFKLQTLYDRWKARVEVGYENDDFTKNLVTILGEERIGFAAKRPQALVKGDFATIGVE